MENLLCHEDNLRVPCQYLGDKKIDPVGSGLPFTLNPTFHALLRARASELDGHGGLRPLRYRRGALHHMTVIDPKRSANMARIGPGNTAPELAVRRALHRMGYRFRLHRSDLPGRPDVVLPRHRTIFLIHGCFWHRHAGCRFAYSPKSRVGFWEGKFERNVIRDQKVERELREGGWLVHTIWECETRDPDALGARLRELLTGGTA